MTIGHDVVISVKEKLRSYPYSYFINYIGMNYNKENINDNNHKNGLRIIQKNCRGIRRSKIRKWAQSRCYYGRQAIVMDVEVSNEILNACEVLFADQTGSGEYLALSRGIKAANKDTVIIAT